MSTNPTSTSEPIAIAILDDYASTAPSYFAALPNVSITHIPETIAPLPYTPSSLSAQAARLAPYTIISTMRERTPFPRALLAQLPQLRLLLTTGMRNAAIDLPACRDHGVTVAGTPARGHFRPGYDVTNEQTWALILGLAKGIARDDRVVKEEKGGWQSGLSMGLSGKTLGVLGLGKLGMQCAVTGRLGFGMDVVCWSSSLTQARADEVAAERGVEAGVFRVVGSKRELFERADVLSVHYVLSERSRGIVGGEELTAMKRSAILVNTSRGPLVDERALLQCLNEGRIRGAALDVFDVEPLPETSEWRTTRWGEEGRSRVLLSPHTGYVEEETIHSWYKQTAENVQRWMKGEELVGLMAPGS